MLAMLSQPLREPLVIWIRQLSPLVDQLVESPFNSMGPPDKLPRSQLSFSIAQLQSISEQGAYLTSEANRPAALLLFKGAGILDQMRQTLLLDPCRECLVIIGREAVTVHNSPELSSEDIDDNLVSTALRDRRDGHFTVSEDPQPCRKHADSPPRLIDMEGGRSLDLRDQILIDRCGALGHSHVRLVKTAPRDIEREDRLKQIPRLLKREPQSVFEVAGHSFGSRPDDRPGCSHGPADLFRVRGADSLTAPAAVAAMGDKAGDDRLDRRNVDLELLMLSALCHVAAALRALSKWRFPGLIDFILCWRLAMREAALSRTATALVVMRFTFLASKRRGLALGRAFKLKDALLKLLDQFRGLSQLRFQFSNTPISRVCNGFAH